MPAHLPALNVFKVAMLNKKFKAKMEELFPTAFYKKYFELLKMLQKLTTPPDIGKLRFSFKWTSVLQPLNIEG
jgi:hypothetical protein